MGGFKLGHIGKIGYGGIGGLSMGKIGGIGYGDIGGLYSGSLLGAANPNAQDDEPTNVGQPDNVNPNDAPLQSQYGGGYPQSAPAYDGPPTLPNGYEPPRHVPAYSSSSNQYPPSYDASYQQQYGPSSSSYGSYSTGQNYPTPPQTYPQAYPHHSYAAPPQY